MPFCVVCYNHFSGEERNSRRVKVLLALINHHDVKPGWGVMGVGGCGAFVIIFTEKPKSFLLFKLCFSFDPNLKTIKPSWNFFSSEAKLHLVTHVRGGGGSVRLTFYSMINAAAPRRPGNMAEAQKSTDWERCCGQ